MRPLPKVLEASFASLVVLFGTDVAAAQAPQGPVRIMPLGDSITAGLPDTGGWRAELFERLEAELFDVDFVGSAPPFSDPALLDDWHHAGHSGWTIADLTEFSGPGAPPSTIETWLEVFDPSIVLLHAGTNDLGIGQLTPMQAGKRLQALMQRIFAHSPTVHLVLARIVPPAPEVFDWNWALFNMGVDYLTGQAQAAGFSVTVADMYGAFVQAPNWSDLYLDPIHPNQAGYDLMADVWFETLDDLVQSLGTTPVNPPLIPPPIVQKVSESPLDGAFTCATNDLISPTSPAFAGVVHVGYDGGPEHPIDALTDGDAGPGATLVTDAADEQWISTFALDLEASPTGYDIQAIRGFNYAGGPPGSGGYGAQSYLVMFETVDDPGNFKPLGSFRYAYSTGFLAPPTGGSGLVRITRQFGPLAGGVSAIRIRFSPDPGLNALTGYTELDVLGAPTSVGH